MQNPNNSNQEMPQEADIIQNEPDQDMIDNNFNPPQFPKNDEPHLMPKSKPMKTIMQPLEIQ
jgi:hypothetical protein